MPEDCDPWYLFGIDGALKSKCKQPSINGIIYIMENIEGCIPLTYGSSVTI